jgi:cell division initiation protein
VTNGEKNVPHLSPAGIRSEVFGHRMRGLDEDEVREYLEALADQVEDMQSELARRRAEVEQLRAENRGLREESERASATPQTVALINQAQQVADQVVEQAVLHARELMVSARNQQRDILRSAYAAAEEAARRTGTPRPQVPQPRAAAKAWDVRTTDRVTRAELRSVVDALTGQWDGGSSESESTSIYDQVWSIRGRTRG